MKRTKEIIGLPIISVLNGTEIGMVRNIIINAEDRSLSYIIVDNGLHLLGAKVISTERTLGIGEHAVTVEDEDVISMISKIPAAMDLLEKNVQIRGSRVLTKKGKLVGEITEIYVDEEDRCRIKGLEFTPLRADGSVKFLPDKGVVTYGKHLIIVSDSYESMLSDVSEISGRPAHLRNISGKGAAQQTSQDIGKAHYSPAKPDEDAYRDDGSAPYAAVGPFTIQTEASATSAAVASADQAAMFTSGPVTAPAGPAATQINQITAQTASAAPTAAQPPAVQPPVSGHPADGAVFQVHIQAPPTQKPTDKIIISQPETVGRAAAADESQALDAIVDEAVFAAPSEKKSPEIASEPSPIPEFTATEYSEPGIAAVAEPPSGFVYAVDSISAAIVADSISAAIAGDGISAAIAPEGMRAAIAPEGMRAPDVAPAVEPASSAEVVSVFKFGAGADAGKDAVSTPETAKDVIGAANLTPAPGAYGAVDAIEAAGAKTGETIAGAPPTEEAYPVESAAVQLNGKAADIRPNVPEKILPNGESRVPTHESKAEYAEAIEAGFAVEAASDAQYGTLPEEAVVSDKDVHTAPEIAKKAEVAEPYEPARDAGPAPDAPGAPIAETGGYREAEAGQTVITAEESAVASIIADSAELSVSHAESAGQVVNVGAAPLETESEPPIRVADAAEEAVIAKAVTDDIIVTEASLFEQRQKKYLTGRIVTKTILDTNGDTLIEEGVKITGDLIDKVRASGRMVQLVMNNRA